VLCQQKCTKCRSWLLIYEGQEKVCWQASCRTVNVGGKMAIHEDGVGVSFKLPDGTIVWVHRDSWADVTMDIPVMFGEGALERIEGLLQKAWGGGGGSGAPSAPAASPAPQEAAAPAPSDGFQLCPVHNIPKDRWVPGGVSKRTNKPYSGFFGCSVEGCKGR
jgi:hypothetical protein